MNTMHKTPEDIARSLRAFKNARKLGLLRGVRIAPGPGAVKRRALNKISSTWAVPYLNWLSPNAHASFAYANTNRVEANCYSD